LFDTDILTTSFKFISGAFESTVRLSSSANNTYKYSENTKTVIEFVRYRNRNTNSKLYVQ